MTDVFAMIAAERRATADLLDGLTDEQWTAQTLCTGWTVEDMAAHLLMPFSLSIPRMFVKLIANRFDFDTMSERWAKADPRSRAQRVATLRAEAENRFTPPGLGPEAPLSDIVIHSQDMCRPLMIDRAISPDHAAVILDFLVSPKGTRGFIPKGLTDGLALTAADMGWRHGSGAEVTGNAAALILAISGRASGFDELSGDGVDLLRRRRSV